MPSVDASGPPPPSAAVDCAGRVSVESVAAERGEASLEERVGARAGVVVAAGDATGVGVLEPCFASFDCLGAWLVAGTVLAGFAGLAPWPPPGAWPWAVAVALG
jgi:hypothetical protein